jgi:16S rRNA (cytosine1402-N4)-methyltransferase
LLAEILSLFNQSDKNKFWDCTLGLAGHSIAILEENPEVLGFGSDQDEEMLEKAKLALSSAHLNDRMQLKVAGAEQIPFPNDSFSFILLDLGLSSVHIDLFQRGISFMKDEPLDMRMDLRLEKMAIDVLIGQSEEQLAKIFYEYGEEKRSFRVAKEIKAALSRGADLNSTFALRNLIHNVIKPIPHGSYSKRFPEVKIFQSLRIAVNNEIDRLKEFLYKFENQLVPGGILAIISFHSLEDRVVKQHFRSLTRRENKDPMRKSNLEEGSFIPLTKKPIMASAVEIAKNGRARSAKLRAIQRRNNP